MVPPVEIRQKRLCCDGFYPNYKQCVFFWEHGCVIKQSRYKIYHDHSYDDVSNGRVVMPPCKYHITSAELKELIDSEAIK